MSLENELVKQINSLQKQVDALVKPEVGRWIDWTPTVTQSVVVAKTINYARYIVMQNMVHIAAEMTVTGAGVAGNAIIIAGIPVQPTGLLGGELSTLGTCCVYDASANAPYYGFLAIVSGSDWRLRDSNTRANIGVNPNFALANADIITIRGTYERA